MSSELHQILLGCGYIFTPARQMPKGTLLYTEDRRKGYYVKPYETEAGLFSIALILGDDPHIKLPVAYALHIPEQYRGLLIPHLLSNERILCYVAQMEADWNPNDLDGTYRDIDGQIQKTLNEAALSVENGDSSNSGLEGEFWAYWRAESMLFLLAKPDKRTSLATWLSESMWPDGSLRQEYVTIDSDYNKSQSELSNWLIHRGLKVESLKENPIATHYIFVKPTRLAGVNWPPANFRDLLAWLSDVDHVARNSVVDSILSNEKKRHILLFDINQQDILAAYIEIDPKVAGLKRHRNRSSRTKKSSIQHLMSVLGGKQVNLGFKRLSVIKADRDTLLSRNLPRPDIGNLSGKRIALIGCGTIGGYLAGLLLRSGAGCGEQYFHLYDDDFFSPHNFGRHVLTAHDFGLYKVSALVDSLVRSVHIATKIEGFIAQFPITATKLASYDIVIDATGRPPVSKRLATIVRTVPNEQRPILIHAFNDGNGRASKVLVDDGSCCYGCMLADPSIYRNGVDLRFEDVDQLSERYVSCGSTYTPYDAAVSHITAALAQEAVLNTLELIMPWTYNEHILKGSRSRKPQYIKCQPNCTICHV
ncbi:ThiF family adenylyltransferase [Dickeya zeae]|nr:ThiF family adenylyltransferase [Dickeya zeae]